MYYTLYEYDITVSYTVHYNVIEHHIAHVKNIK